MMIVFSCRDIMIEFARRLILARSVETDPRNQAIQDLEILGMAHQVWSFAVIVAHPGKLMHA